MFLPFSVPPQPVNVEPSNTVSKQIVVKRNTVDLQSEWANKTSRPGNPVGSLQWTLAIYLVVGVVLGVLPVLLPPQPTATTEKARTAARTSNFFIKGSQKGGDTTGANSVTEKIPGHPGCVLPSLIPEHRVYSREFGIITELGSVHRRFLELSIPPGSF